MTKHKPHNTPIESSKAVDHGTVELRQHHMILQTHQRSYVLTQHPLDYYYFAKRILSARQYDAGKLLLSTFDRTGILKGSSLSASMESSGVSSFGAGYADGSHQARIAFRQAVSAIGNDCLAIVMDVVCYGYLLSDTRLSNAQNKTKLFKKGLNRLANFYRIPSR